MKKYMFSKKQLIKLNTRFLVSIVTVTIFLVSCEKIISVDLKTEAARLVVDASINWKKGTAGNQQIIKLTTTAGYNQNTIPVASGAIVTVTNSANTMFIFTEESASGIYVCNNFIPVINENYKLKIVYNGETYISEESLKLTPKISDVEQENDLGFNNDEIGIKINFKDTANQRNFYMMRIDFAESPYPEYQVLDDQFSDGNKITWPYSHIKLATGKILKFTQFGISESYSNYMRILIAASTGSNNGPFQVTPVKVRGNILNQTNTSNYPLGYFRLSETSDSVYTIN